MNPQPQRDLYHRKTDEPIYHTIGTFPLLCAEEIAPLVGRSHRRINSRLKILLGHNVIGRVQAPDDSTYRQIGVPWLYYLRPRKECLPFAPDGVAWHEKSKFTANHDRDLTLIHLAIRDFCSGWIQQKGEDIKETVQLASRHAFFPDARFEVSGTTYFLEYQHTSASSTNSEMDKLEAYNALLKGRKNAKVIFVFTAPHLAKNFLDRAADNFPFLWCWATDIESFKRDPKDRIFGCPKNDEAYGFSDVVL